MAVTRLLRRADSSGIAARVAVAAGEVSDALRSILSRFVSEYRKMKIQ
jgi:hypothetical protein